MRHRRAGAFHPDEANAGAESLGGEPAPASWGTYWLAFLTEREGDRTVSCHASISFY